MNKSQKVNMKVRCISLKEKQVKSSLREIFCVFPSMTSQKALLPKAKMQITIPQPKFTSKTY